MRPGSTSYFLPIALALIALAGCAAPRPQQAGTPSHPACSQEGVASWYAPPTGHAKTADGEVHAASALTAAHPSLPFGTQLLVTNLATGRSVVVRINDRGPVARGRIIDLSAAAAKALDMRQDGIARVRLEMYRAPADSTEAQSTAPQINVGPTKVAQTSVGPTNVAQTTAGQSTAAQTSAARTGVAQNTPSETIAAETATATDPTTAAVAGTGEECPLLHPTKS